MYVNSKYKLIQRARVYNASNLFNEENAFQEHIFLPSIDFVNKTFLDNTKHPEKSINIFQTPIIC